MPTLGRRTRRYDRDILALAVPSLGALVAEPLYVLVDTAVVGHIGTAELAGLAMAGTVLNSSFWIFSFLSYGTTAAVARYHGAGNDRGATIAGVQGTWLAVFLGVAVGLLGQLAVAPVIELFGASAAAREAGRTYLHIALLASPAVLVAAAGIGYLRGRQDARSPLRVALIANGVNAVAEVVWIYGFGGGIAASAVSTVVVQYGAAFFYAKAVLVDARRSGVPLAPELARIRSLLVVGRDLFIRTGSIVGALAFATIVAGRISTDALAANQIGWQVVSLLALALDALGIAGQAMVGRFLGRDEALAARDASRRMLELGVMLGLGLGVIVAVLHDALPRLFSSDPEVRLLASQILLIVAALQPINAVNFVLDGVLIGAGDMRFLAKAMFVACVVCYVPCAALVLVLDLGLLWLWGAMAVMMLARLAFTVTRFLGDAWLVTGAERAR